MLRRIWRRLSSGHSETGAYCVLLFPDSEAESQWFHRVPKPGTHIRNDWRRVRVVEVLRSGRNTYTLICGIRDGPPEGPPTLATDLLERARGKVSERQYRRNYHKYKL